MLSVSRAKRIKLKADDFFLAKYQTVVPSSNRSVQADLSRESGENRELNPTRFVRLVRVVFKG
jgi:hypothetical protein